MCGQRNPKGRWRKLLISVFHKRRCHHSVEAYTHSYRLVLSIMLSSLARSTALRRSSHALQQHTKTSTRFMSMINLSDEDAIEKFRMVNSKSVLYFTAQVCYHKSRRYNNVGLIVSLYILIDLISLTHSVLQCSVLGLLLHSL